MRTINLLPWREERRRERQRNFLVVLVIVGLLAAGCVFAVNRYYEARIDNQNARNLYLQNQITRLDRQIARIDELEETRAQLLERKRVIENLQANRTLMVRLFEQLVRTVPTGIRLLNVQQAGNQLTITGTSQSSARVSTYMRNMESSPILHDPRLQIVESEEGESADPQMPYRFRVSVTLAPPEDAPGDNESDVEVASP